jgi:cation:H+ antiporter
LRLFRLHRTAEDRRVTWPFIYIFIGLVLLFGGGEGLVRGAASLALRLGLTPLIVGLTVVAFGTSAPELVVGVQAALAGQGGIAVGNVIGSNVLNIGLILGITALICPLNVQLQILRVDAPVMIGVSLAGLLVLRDLTVTRPEGALLAVGLVAYVVLTVVLTRKMAAPAEVEAEYAESIPPVRGSILRDLLFIGGGLVLLVAGSHFLVAGAVTIARSFGISEAVIGLTIVAAGTSMPELATCVVAAFKKQADLALGNIIGSNIFNILGILGVAALAKPIIAEGVKMTDLYVMIGFAAVLIPIMRSGFRFQRWEGAFVLVCYVVYTWWLWPK